jgi:DNA-binding transcriptional regulator YdaS (Cro superfamily)
VPLCGGDVHRIDYRLPQDQVCKGQPYIAKNVATMERQQQPSEPPHDVVVAMVREVRGTAGRIAQACGLGREAVWRWRKVPARHVLAVESLLGIPRHKIRPDIYPPPQDPSTKRWLKNGRKQHDVNA